MLRLMHVPWISRSYCLCTCIVQSMQEMVVDDEADPYDVIERQKLELMDCHEMMEVMQVKLEKLTKFGVKKVF